MYGYFNRYSQKMNVTSETNIQILQMEILLLLKYRCFCHYLKKQLTRKTLSKNAKS